MGNTATHRGGVLPGWVGQEGRGDPWAVAGRERTCRCSWRSRHVRRALSTVMRVMNRPMGIGRRRTQFGAGRGTRWQRRSAAGSRRRVTSAAPDMNRERSKERAWPKPDACSVCRPALGGTGTLISRPRNCPRIGGLVGGKWSQPPPHCHGASTFARQGPAGGLAVRRWIGAGLAQQPRRARLLA